MRKRLIRECLNRLVFLPRSTLTHAATRTLLAEKCRTSICKAPCRQPRLGRGIFRARLAAQSTEPPCFHHLKASQTANWRTPTFLRCPSRLNRCSSLVYPNEWRRMGDENAVCSRDSRDRMTGRSSPPKVTVTPQPREPLARYRRSRPEIGSVVGPYPNSRNAKW